MTNNQVNAASINIAVYDSNKNLSRFIFDQLLDRDLLGILLSSKHFKLALMNITLNHRTELPEPEMLREILSDNVKVLEFHQLMLSMYAGIYIEECKHDDPAKLMLDLDKKYAATDSSSFTFSENCPFEINHVALDWRYRHHCAVELSAYH